ncbi:response regulator [Oligoflexus tunisiensis]|uniref:response regulator n=1 Tax=Oligoflexus tunisiensis TaxID=708132 RepID=UPI00114D1DA3|nr:response regulator [Oligoflexus tunisiensis]
MIKKETLQKFSDKHQLTSRQREILKHFIENEHMASAEIAAKIGCSLATVNVHFSNIFTKVGCRSKAEVVRLVLQYAATTADEDPLSINSRIILSADDDPILLEGIARRAEELFKGKITFFPCRNGQELLMHLSRTKQNDPDFPRPHIILLDLQMPGMDGYEALRRIKSDPALKDIPVVVFSSTISSENSKELYALGANSIVLKPSNPEALTKVIQSILQYWGL